MAQTDERKLHATPDTAEEGVENRYQPFASKRTQHELVNGWNIPLQTWDI